MRNFQILEFTHEVFTGFKFYLGENDKYYTPEIPSLEMTFPEMNKLGRWYISSFRRTRDAMLFSTGDLVHGHHPLGTPRYTKEKPGKVKKFLFSADGFYANFGDAYVIDFDNLKKD